MASQALYYKWFHRRSQEGNRRILNSVMDNFILCHVRAATKGSVTDENAHPFEFEKLIGMHNGTLRDKKYEDKHKTDSELMFKDMDERGIVPVIESLDPWSACASVVFNKETGEVSFFRNDQRTLFYAVHATRDVLYYASEAWMLKEMCARNTEKLFKDSIWMFKPDIVYTVHPQDVKSKTAMPFDQVPFKPRKVIQHHGGGRFRQQEQLLLSAPSQEESQEAIVRQAMGLGPERNFSNQNQKKVQPVIRHDFSKPTINSKTKIPTVFCCACNKRMTLVDVFYATKLNQAGTTVVCVECDKTFQTDLKNEQAEVIVH